MEQLKPIDTRHLFVPLHGALMDLARNLNDEQWTRPTVAGTWRVRDVVAHILDGELRALATLRDGHLPPPDGTLEDYDSLVAYLDRSNADWIKASARLSPRLLVELLQVVGPRAAETFAGQALDTPAPFAVDWAGESTSRNWIHIGREYTERWHHQMQVRDAVGVRRLLEKPWLVPLLDLSVRALPLAYAETPAPAGTAVVLEVEGFGSWSLVASEQDWRILRGAAESPGAHIRMQPDIAWRLFYNALSPEAARRAVDIEGDVALAEPLLRARSVMVRRPRP